MLSYTKHFLRLFVPFKNNWVYLDVYEFDHVALLKIWSSNNRSEEAIRSYVLKNVNCDPFDDILTQLITQKTKDFIKYIKKHLPKCSRNIERFKKVHARWLAGSMIIRLCAQNESPQKGGRPKLPYEEAGIRLKRKLASEVAVEHNHSTPLLLHATTISAK